MRNLKYAILGLLNQKNMTGYELLQSFEKSLAQFWTAKHSQIYPELKKLAKEGMVEYEILPDTRILDKKVYRITQQGKADFKHWLALDDEISPVPKDIFRLRLFFAEELSNDRRIYLIERQLEQHKKRLNLLRAQEGKEKSVVDIKTREFSDYIIWLGAIKRETAYCEWLEECIKLCQNNILTK